MDISAEYEYKKDRSIFLISFLTVLFFCLAVALGIGAVQILDRPAKQLLGNRSIDSIQSALETRQLSDSTSGQGGMGGAFLPNAVLPPVTFFTYTIQKGDSIHSISSKLGIDEVTIIKYNNILIPAMIQLGQKLTIPNQDGISVKANQKTLDGIAKKYDFTPEELLRLNSIGKNESFSSLFIPGIHFNSVSKQLLLGEYFRKPAWGRISSGFGYRRDPFTGRWSFHQGVDIKNRYGTYIRAAAPGKVVFSGWVPIYGRMVKIQHTSGFVSYYGHLGKTYVRKNMWIPAGKVIGLMGSSGRSTGPHVHFEIRQYGRVVNPMKITVF